jgi:hypothetical protein
MILLVVSNTINAALLSFKYPGIKLLNLYCPAVSHNCNRIFLLLSRVRVLDRKSIPIVGLMIYKNTL